MAEVRVGQIWLDNYGGATPDSPRARFVKIVGMDKLPSGEVAHIRRCTKEGGSIRNSPGRHTKISRFGLKGQNGFTLIRDVEQQEPANG